MSPFPHHNSLPGRQRDCGPFSRPTQRGLPRWLMVKNPPTQAGKYKWPRFHPWVRKIPWRRKQQPTPVFSPGEFLGQRSVPSVGSQRVGHDWSDFACSQRNAENKWKTLNLSSSSAPSTSSEVFSGMGEVIWVTKHCCLGAACIKLAFCFSLYFCLSLSCSNRLSAEREKMI